MIKIVCVGKVKEKYLREAIDDYEKRIGKYHKIDIIEVDDLGNGAVNNGTRIGEDHNALLIEHIGCLDACDHIADPDGSGIIDHMDLEIRIRMNGHLLACDIAAALENFLILVRNKVRRLE